MSNPFWYNEPEYRSAYWTRGMTLVPLRLYSSKEAAALYAEYVEKYGGAEDFICGAVIKKSMSLRDKRIDATIFTPVIEDDGVSIGTRITKAFITDDDVAALSLLYKQIDLEDHDFLIVEKRTGKVVRLIFELQYMNDFYNHACGSDCLTHGPLCSPLPPLLSAEYLALAEKYGGAEEFICGEVMGKNLNLRDKRIEVTLQTPVLVNEDDGKLFGTRTTQAIIADEDTTALVHLYGKIFPYHNQILAVEKRTRKVVRLLNER